jgi:hypothetical protein
MLDALPYGELPPRESFLARVHGPYEILLDDEDAIYIITGAINQGLDDEMISIGAEGKWITNGLSLMISDGRSLYALVCRLVDIERDHGNGAGALAHDILKHFGYGWEQAQPEVILDGEIENIEGSFENEG